MVYRGKPSKACEPCRKRKLVCDLKVPSCSSCRRAKLICHGYRDTESLRVTDETSSVRRRIQGSAEIVAKRRVPQSASGQSQSMVHIVRYAERVPRSLVKSHCNLARDLFYYNYVFGDLKPFEFLQSLYSPSSKDDHLTASMDATALAYLNYQQFSPKLQIEAREHYVTALRLLCKVLQNPVSIKKDSTILSILLLDLYEKVTNREPSYEGAWAAHLQGALTLVKMRGNEQFDDPTHLLILLRVSINHIISCIASHRSVPKDVLSLRDDIASRIGGPRYSKTKESDLMVEYARLRNDIEKGHLGPKESIPLIRDLDSRFNSIFLQSSWKFKTVHVSEKSVRHWESHHHIYSSDQIAQVWNVLRVTRILLNELLLSQISIKEEKCSNQTSPPVYQQTTEVILDMISEICAAVPQYIGDPSLKVVENPHLLAAKTQTHDWQPSPGIRSSNPTYYLPCYRLIFPLYIAAQSLVAPLQLKPWIIRQLRFMADHHGIENAAHVADILKSGENKDPWLVYAMLGSYAFVC